MLHWESVSIITEQPVGQVYKAVKVAIISALVEESQLEILAKKLQFGAEGSDWTQPIPIVTSEEPKLDNDPSVKKVSVR